MFKIAKLTGLALIILLVVAGIYWLWHTRSIQPIKLSPEEITTVEKKAEPILALKKSEGKHLIEFSEREINGILHHASELGGNLQFDFSEDLIIFHGRFQVPEEIPVLGGNKVRIHGELVIQLDQEEPYFGIRKLSSFGLAIPDDYIKDYLHRNLYQDLKDAIGLDAYIGAIERLKIKEDKIVLTLF